MRPHGRAYRLGILTVHFHPDMRMVDYEVERIFQLDAVLVGNCGVVGTTVTNSRHHSPLEIVPKHALPKAARRK